MCFNLPDVRGRVEYALVCAPCPPILPTIPRVLQAAPPRRRVRYRSVFLSTVCIPNLRCLLRFPFYSSSFLSSSIARIQGLHVFAFHNWLTDGGIVDKEYTKVCAEGTAIFGFEVLRGMKFGKRLQSQIEETLPEWRDKYLSYKQLKKRLKLISAPECFTEAAFSSPEHESGVTIPPEEALRLQIPACGASQSTAGTTNAAQNSKTANVPASSEGQDSSVNGGSVTGAKSSSGSAGVVSDPDRGATELSVEEADFIHLLNAELEKFNTFFIEKEEEYVIRLQELKERCEQLKERSSKNTSHSESSLNEEMINIRKEIVNFHGEMVLLLNYSSLNYTGLVKILKKHDKRTGALLRMPFIRNVLHQPFFTTELLSKLVRECEMNLQSLFPPSADATEAPIATANHQPGMANTSERKDHGVQEQPGDTAAADKDNLKSAAAQEHSLSQGEDVDSIYRSTLAALRTIKELRRGSSTYSIFSLPPFSKDEDGGGDDVNGAPCVTIPICSRK